MKKMTALLVMWVCLSGLWAQQMVMLFDFEARGVDSTVIRITN